MRKTGGAAAVCLNAGMSTPGRNVMTQVPALLVVTDLGDRPSALTVGSYFQRLSSLWTFAAEIAVLQGKGRYTDYLRQELDARAGGGSGLIGPPIPLAKVGAYFIDGRIGRLGVHRIRLGSPLETLLAAIFKDLAPLGYVIGGMLVFERAVKLLMEWQRHRSELQQRPEGDTAIQIVDELTEGTVRRPLIEAQLQAHQDVTYLLRVAPIIRVERLDAPPSPSDD